MATEPSDLVTLLEEIRACRLCDEFLPLGARPVIQCHSDAKILIVGQAPGKKVHDTGIPFNDPSGDRLRQWMGIDKEDFYNPQKIALLPMGFCFPGTGKSGDLPPRPECAAAWREKLLAQLPNIQTTLLLGKYAQDFHLGKRSISLTERVRAWERYWPEYLPTPHPSPRNNIWLRNNPWFEQEVIPELQALVADVLNRSATSQTNCGQTPLLNN